MNLFKFNDFILFEYNYKNNVSNEFIKPNEFVRDTKTIKNPWHSYTGEVSYDDNEIGNPSFAEEADYYKLKRLENNLKA